MIKKYFLSIFAVVMANLSIQAQLACRANVNLALDLSGSGTLTPEILVFGALNPAHTYTLSKSTFTCADIGTPQTVTVSEFSGGVLINSCFSTVIVEDKLVPPVCSSAIACLATLNVALGVSGTATIGPETILYGPLNPAYTYTLSKSTFTCADIGTPQTVVVSQFLAGALVNSCFTTVNVEDKLVPPVCSAPTLVCFATITTSLGADGTVTLTPGDVLLSPLEPSYTYTVTPASFDCTNIGSNTVQVTVTTPAGFTNTCVFTVIVEDKRISPPPCVSLNFEGIRFIPDLWWKFPVPPLTVLAFDVRLTAQTIDKNTKSDLVFAISKDKVLDANDVIVYQSGIKLNKKTNAIEMQGKITIPANINAGNYFLLGDVVTKKKKSEVSLQTYNQAFEVGFGNQNFRIPKKNTSLTDKLVYPNPFTSILYLHNDDSLLQNIQVYNLTGQMIKNLAVKPSEQSLYQIDLSDIQRGMYLIKMTDVEGQVSTTTVVKEE